jgi:hypothetical protein
MSDRPIIFSAPMVRALLAGRKTQTRRLATSPLRRCEVGDRLYVREAALYWWRAGDGQRDKVAAFAADSYELEAGERWTPSIHMPREFSRLTLIVEDMKVEPLLSIDLRGLCGEGVYQRRGSKLWWIDETNGCFDPDIAFAHLWDALHTKPGERWGDNPQVVALTFRVVHGNIDQVAS